MPYFDRFAPLYDRVMPPADASVLEPGLRQAVGPVERLLDVGGGTGRGARALSVPEAVVVDASRPMLRRARGHGLACVQGDSATLPVADGSVDAVLVIDALHHFPEIDGTVAAAARALRPGGALVVREFDPGTLRGRALVAAEHLVGFRSTFLGPDDLGARMEDAGLEPVILDRGFAYTVAGVRPEHRDD